MSPAPGPEAGGTPARGAADGQATRGPWSGGDVIRLGSVDSTNRYARDAVAAGRRGGFVVVADHQEAGRGRRGRAWVEPASGALLCSVVFRPGIDIDLCPVLGIVVALAAIDAIAVTTGAGATLKWPNDVLVGERKVAGVLAELDGAVDHLAIVGIGVNLAFPEGWLDEVRSDDDRPVSDRATTLQLEPGVRVERDEFLDALLVALDARVARDPGDAFVAPTIAEARRRSATLGRRVRVIGEHEEREGIAVGMTESGRLEVDFGGVTEVFDAADVVHLR